MRRYKKLNVELTNGVILTMDNVYATIEDTKITIHYKKPDMEGISVIPMINVISYTMSEEQWIPREVDNKTVWIPDWGKGKKINEMRAEAEMMKELAIPTKPNIVSPTPLPTQTIHG